MNILIYRVNYTPPTSDINSFPFLFYGADLLIIMKYFTILVHHTQIAIPDWKRKQTQKKGTVKM